MTVRILTGDVRAVLPTLASDSVHCVVTSPPYWGLRSYLPDGHPDKHLEIGSEPTLQEWVSTMVEVFREVRRVLRPDGTLWLNLGDSYAGAGRGGYSGDSGTLAGKQPDHSRQARAVSDSQRMNCPSVRGARTTGGLKPKDLMGQPWRVAFALQDDGWWLRQEIIWDKNNPMPESATDRCTKSHEHVFLLTKSERYWFDADAIREPVSPNTHARIAQNLDGQKGSTRANGNTRTDRPMKAVFTGSGVGFGHGTDAAERQRGRVVASTPKAAVNAKGSKQNESFQAATSGAVLTRNKRSVWRISTEGFTGAHYATFPTKLVEPCILAGCPVGGTVLDVFGGSGTTGVVADRHHRDAILIDLDERNKPMATERITGDSPLFAEVTA